MAKIILDTCAWLDLVKPKFSEVLDELEKQVKNNITVIITCDILLDEWNRNKLKIINEATTSFRTHAKSALKIGDFLNDSEKEILKNILEKYSVLEKEQERLALAYIDRVEKLLKNSLKYSINNDLKLEMTNRALDKKAPFHNSKNNMADALIYFGGVEYVVENNQIATDLLFVTNNHKEFGNPVDLQKLHPDLEKFNVHYFNNLAEALEMRKEIIDEMDEYNESKFWSWVDLQVDIARGK